MSLAFNALECVEDLTQEGIEEGVAKVHAKALNNAVQSNLVTKQDLEHKVSKLYHKIDMIESEILTRLALMILASIGIILGVMAFLTGS